MSDEKLTNRLRRSIKTTQIVLLAWQLAGLVAVVLYAVSFRASPDVRPLRVAAVGALLAGAMMFLGFIVGFLFAIPRTRQESLGDDRSTKSASHGPNTNLEQISDWLTKMLVGVGLIQIDEIGAGLWTASELLSPALGGGSATPFVAGVIVYYLACGFLTGYSWTRLFLARAFSWADRDLAEVSRAAEEAKGAAENALGLAQAALQGGTDLVRGATNEEAPTETLDSLAAEYDKVRSAMKRGNQRTHAMTQVMQRMLSVAAQTPDFDVHRALGSDEMGRRLAAYAWFYMHPETDSLGALVDSVATSEKHPFVQLWGLRSVERMVNFATTVRPDVVERLRRLGEGFKPHWDRYAQLDRVLKMIA